MRAGRTAGGGIVGDAAAGDSSSLLSCLEDDEGADFMLVFDVFVESSPFGAPVPIDLCDDSMGMEGDEAEGALPTATPEIVWRSVENAGD